MEGCYKCYYSVGYMMYVEIMETCDQLHPLGALFEPESQEEMDFVLHAFQPSRLWSSASKSHDLAIPTVLIMV